MTFDPWLAASRLVEFLAVGPWRLERVSHALESPPTPGARAVV
jgi:hypothetical protein